jgi:hypothetical protein
VTNEDADEVVIVHEVQHRAIFVLGTMSHVATNDLVVVLLLPTVVILPPPSSPSASH